MSSRHPHPLAGQLRHCGTILYRHPMITLLAALLQPRVKCRTPLTCPRINGAGFMPPPGGRSPIAGAFARVSLVAAMTILCPVSSQARTCKALLVANAQYQEQPLVNPRRDAILVAQALEVAKCEAELVFDSTRENVNSRIISVARNLVAGDVFVLYYSGHGYETNSNFHMLFSEVMRGSTRTSSVENVASLSLFTILALPVFEQGFTSLFVLDACRTAMSPSRDIGDTQSSQRMPIVKAPLTILYSTAPGSPAYDNRTRNTSLFSEVLAKQIQASGASIDSKELALKNTAALVAQESGFNQQPWISSTTSLFATSGERSIQSAEVRESIGGGMGNDVSERNETPKPTVLVMSSEKAISHEIANEACRTERARLPTVEEAQELSSLSPPRSPISSGIWALNDSSKHDRCVIVGGSWHSIVPADSKLVRRIPCAEDTQVKDILCVRLTDHRANDFTSFRE